MPFLTRVPPHPAGSSGDPCNNGPNPTTHPSSPDRSNPHADNAAAAAAVAQLNELHDGIYSSRASGGNGNGTITAAARGGGADKNGGAPQLPPADRLVAALMQGTGLEGAGGQGEGGSAGVKLEGGLNGASVDGAVGGAGPDDGWAPNGRAGGSAPAGGSGGNGQMPEDVVEELQQLRGLPPQVLQQLLAKGVSPAALQVMLLQTRLEHGGGPLEPGPGPGPRQALEGSASDSQRGLEQQQAQQQSWDGARATPPPPQRQLKLEEREAHSRHDEAQRAADCAEPRVRVKAEAEDLGGRAGIDDAARRQPSDNNDSRADSGARTSHQQTSTRGQEGLRAQGRAAKTQLQASQSHRAGPQQDEAPDNGRRGAGASKAPQQPQPLQLLPTLAAGSIEAAVRSNGALAAAVEGEASGNSNGNGAAAGSLPARRESDDERLDGSRGARPGLLQVSLRPHQGDQPSPMADGDARGDGGAALRALAAGSIAGGGGGHPLQALAAAMAANGGAVGAGGLGGVLAGIAAARDGGGGLSRLEQLAALINGGGGGGPGGGGGEQQLGLPGGQNFAMLNGGGGGGGGMLGALLAEAQRGRAAAAAAAGLGPLGTEAEEGALMELIRVSLAEAEAAEAARARAANRALEAAARLMQARQARARAGAQLPPGAWAGLDSVRPNSPACIGYRIR